MSVNTLITPFAICDEVWPVRLHVVLRKTQRKRELGQYKRRDDTYDIDANTDKSCIIPIYNDTTSRTNTTIY